MASRAHSNLGIRKISSKGAAGLALNRLLRPDMAEALGPEGLMRIPSGIFKTNRQTDSGRGLLRNSAISIWSIER